MKSALQILFDVIDNQGFNQGAKAVSWNDLKEVMQIAIEEEREQLANDNNREDWDEEQH